MVSYWMVFSCLLMMVGCWIVRVSLWCVGVGGGLGWWSFRCVLVRWCLGNQYLYLFWYVDFDYFVLGVDQCVIGVQCGYFVQQQGWWVVGDLWVGGGGNVWYWCQYVEGGGGGGGYYGVGWILVEIEGGNVQQWDVVYDVCCWYFVGQGVVLW